jgi:hypothetical protein
LNLTNFGRDNWQSTLRGDVSIHDKYKGLTDWNAQETADIVYVDTDGGFTEYLRTKCVGEFPVLHDNSGDFQHIEYLIEVKTTTLKTNTRFIISPSQYERVSFSSDKLAGTTVNIDPDRWRNFKLNKSDQNTSI